MAAKFVQESAWALRLPCASVGGSEQAVSTTSCLPEPTLCIQLRLLLDSEAFAELHGGRLRSVMMRNPLEPLPQAVRLTDDRETHRDCLINSQCKPPSSDRPDTPALHCNPPSLSTHGDTDHNLL